MRKWVCTVCGYVYEGENPPERCPQCGVPTSKFKEQEANKMVWACEHEVGAAQGSPEDIITDLGANFEDECSGVSTYLTMPRVAHREGHPETGMYWIQVTFREAEHTTKFVELLDEVVTSSTRKNLEMRVAAENGATAGKFDLTKRTEALNLDVIHDMVHETAKDEVHHGEAFEGLLRRYFG